jgi:hypothetical protein
MTENETDNRERYRAALHTHGAVLKQQEGERERDLQPPIRSKLDGARSKRAGVSGLPNFEELLVVDDDLLLAEPVSRQLRTLFV